MRRFLLSLLVFSLVSFSALAQAPYDYKSLTIDGSLVNPVTLTGTSGSSISRFTANMSWFPRDRPGQEVLSLATDPQADVSEESIVFTLHDPPLGDHSFDIGYEVRTTADMTPVKDKVSFPIKSLPSRYEPYLQATETIDITPEMRSLAADIAGDERDLFRVLARLASWTREHVEYNLSTTAVEASKPSSWVLENRQGVCDEITNLFISFSRSLGIPARFVSGLAYTDSPEFEDSWGAHGWAEVYIPGAGWVPFDVTYGQLGWVDATHVVFHHDVDSGKYASSYTWLGRNVDAEVGGMRLEAAVDSRGDLLEPKLDISVEPLEDEVGFGSYQLAIVEVENEADRYVAETMRLAPVDDLSFVDDQSRVVALAPGESRTLYWRVRVSDELDEGYVYSFPLIVSSRLGSNAESGFKVSPNARSLSESWVDRFAESLDRTGSSPYASAVSFACDSSSSRKPRTGETVGFRCRLDNQGESTLKDVEVCFRDDCQVLRVRPGEQGVASFESSFDKSSVYALPFTASNDLIEKFSYVSLEVVEQPEVAIVNLSAPEAIDFSGSGEVRFTVARVKGAVPRDLRVSLRGPRMAQSWSFSSLQDEKVFSIDLAGDALSLEDESFDVVVSYVDDRGERLSVKESFDVALGEASWWQRFFLWVLDLFGGS
ncbi:MAG: transglutaminase domain-containing protein [Candidatus Woesearchaeota archaeon]